MCFVLESLYRDGGLSMHIEEQARIVRKCTSFCDALVQYESFQLSYLNLLHSVLKDWLKHIVKTEKI